MKRALTVNKHLRVILMSATIDVNLFSYYFSCPTLDIPGKIFDVECHYLEQVLELVQFRNAWIDEILESMNAQEKPPDENHLLDQSLTSKVDALDLSDDALEPPQQTSEVIRVIDGMDDDDLEERVCDAIKNCFLEADGEAVDQFVAMVMVEGVNINYKHKETDMSMLMAVAGKGMMDSVRKLLEMGADPMLTTRHGLRAYDVAMEMDEPETAEMLREVMPYVTEPSATNSQVTPVQKILLEGYMATVSDEEINHELLVHLICEIHFTQPDGAILVFLPGYADILEQADLINAKLPTDEFKLYMLHSHMETKDQKSVFGRLPQNTRKIILSTNLAETSITIDDVVYVIDAGRVKEQTFDPISGSSCLATAWISKACAKQRAGRAGRVQPGVCFRLYSSDRYEAFDEYTMPELLRVPLTEICIQAKLIDKDKKVAEFLRDALQPPNEYNIEQSIRILQAIGALDESENLTELGVHLGDIPIDVRFGKMLIYGVLLKCLDPVLTIVSALSVSDPFMLPSQPQERGKVMRMKHDLGENSFSDHFVLLRLYQQWSEQKQTRGDRRYCLQHYIRPGNFQGFQRFSMIRL